VSTSPAAPGADSSPPAAAGPPAPAQVDRSPPPTRRGGAAPPSRDESRRRARGLARPGLLLVGAAVVVSALSLLVPWSLAFDPQAWVVWGRDTGRLALDTRAGPSWKPLPVLVTTPLAVTGDAAPALWMIVARTGGLLALAGAATLAWRIAGPVAAAAAGAFMAVSPWWAYNGVLGNSEGLLVAALLWAVVAHLDGRPRVALALATAGAMLRPEVWPLLVAYGIWLWRTDPGARRRLVAAGLAVPVLWLGPDLIGIGGAVRASSAARGEPSPGSAGLEDIPGLAVLADAVWILTWPAAIAAVAGAVTGPPAVRLLGAAAAGWTALVAVMAQVGYAGNPRYLVAAAGVGCVLAGVGAGRAGAAVAGRVGGAGRRAVPAGVAALVVMSAGLVALPELRDRADEVALRAERWDTLDDAVAAAGGRDALVRCSRVRTAADVRPLIAWELDLPMLDLDMPPTKPALVIRYSSHFTGRWNPIRDPAAEGYRPLGRAPGWDVWAACGRAPQIQG
jgi:hypothetical protein